MPRLEQATRNGTPYYNIMDHRGEISKKWKEVDQLLRFEGVLDSQLKEEVRRALSQYSGCKFCASLGEPKSEYEDIRIATAVQFATEVVQGPGNVSDETFAPLLHHFSAEEIVELSTWISFMFGAELFGAIMKLEPATDLQKTSYEAWLKQGNRLAAASRK
jgi:alkylhydroperoxidase family enzyme